MIYEGGRPTPGKDDGLVISLLRTNSDIQTYFRHTGHLLPNQLATNLRLEVDCGKLAYYDWVGTKLKLRYYISYKNSPTPKIALCTRIMTKSSERI